MIKGYLKLALYDRDGRLLEERVQEMRSLLDNFIVLLESVFKGVDTRFPPPEPPKVTLPDGTLYQIPRTLLTPGTVVGWRVDAEAGEILYLRGEPTDWGVIVGSDDSPNTITVYRLYAPYPHGKGVGYMNYLSTTITPPYFDGANVRMDITRLVLNESDSTQVVREVGVMVREYYTWQRFLIAREALASPISMPPRSMLQVTITLVAVPAPFTVIYVSDFAVGGETATRSIV